MSYKTFFKLLKFIFIFSFLSCLQCCGEKDKQIVLTDSMKEDIISEEDQILDLIHEGNTHLDSNAFDEAKACYEKAISMDITNESAYIEIKNNYINAKRYDDAYYIIKLAIDNNVSRESMEALLKDISSHFSPTVMAVSIYEGDNYTLPSKVSVPINDIDTEANIRWDKSKIDTSNVGTFTFEGYADEYGRTVSLSLNISQKPIEKNSIQPSDTTIAENKSKPVSSSLVGFIEDIYDKFGITYIVFDEIQFFDNPDEAKKEYLKDHAEPSPFAIGSDFYYRNVSQDTKTYKLNADTSLNLCNYVLNPNSNNYIELSQVSLDTFKAYINKHKENDSGALLFRINLTNDSLSNVNMMYLA